MNQALIATGSISDVAQSGDAALAILRARAAVICDRSLSMMEQGRHGQARYELEDAIIAKLQASHPGQVVLAAFSDRAALCLDGVLPAPGGATLMLGALGIAASLAAAGLRIILITDGEPTESQADVIAQAAGTLQGQLDVVYVGPEGEPGHDFCKRLAAAVKGSASDCDLDAGPELLERSLARLLLTAGVS